MSLQEKDIEVIDAYLEGRLCAEEQFYIEEKIAYDPEFATEVKEYRSVVNGIKELSQGPPLKPGFATKPKSTNSRISNQLLSIVAKSSVVLLVFSIPIILLLTRTTGVQAIFNRHFNPYLPDIARADDEDKNSFFGRALADYKKGDFKQASLFFEAHLLENPSHVQAMLLNGISHIATNDSKEAADILESVVAKTDNTCRKDAYYFLGLANLDLNDLNKASKAFDHVTGNESQYKKSAVIILKEIDILKEQKAQK